LINVAEFVLTTTSEEIQGERAKCARNIALKLTIVVNPVWCTSLSDADHITNTIARLSSHHVLKAIKLTSD
jgi:hypothetical protein